MNPAEPLENERHEAFAVHFAANGNAARAWLHAGGRNRATANRQGDKWRRKGDIAARVPWLRAEAGRRLRSERNVQNEAAVMSIMDKRRFLARIVRARIAETPAESDLWQEIELSNGRLRKKLPDKLRAIALDNDLAGEGADAKAVAGLPEAIERLMDLVFPA